MAALGIIWADGVWNLAAWNTAIWAQEATEGDPANASYIYRPFSLNWWRS